MAFRCQKKSFKKLTKNEEYDYEANEEEEPENIDPDNELYGDTQITIREKMLKTTTEAFKPGWWKEEEEE